MPNAKHQTMKQKLLISCVIILLLLSGIWLTRKHWISLFLNFEPRNPRIEIQEIHNIGWWSQQEKLEIDTFYISIVESKLNLFNSYSLISYTIKGRLIDSSANWRPEIKEVHICERIAHNDSINDETIGTLITKDTLSQDESAKIKPEAIIEITPIVSQSKDKMYKGKTVSFEFTNELKIQSLHWGNNYFLFKCGDFESLLHLRQSK
jgi:hypothetical protein